ncbi:hypothetical protein BGZ94_010391 [Podila epigama]|nr:hypothetical protein BGZ94_010391 [Podila epigama]
MSSFINMNYDSDSDSADDLDFQPTSDISSSSGSSGDESGLNDGEDENMEEVVPEDKDVDTNMSLSLSEERTLLDQHPSLGNDTGAPPATDKPRKSPKKPATSKKTATNKKPAAAQGVDDAKPKVKKTPKKTAKSAETGSPGARPKTTKSKKTKQAEKQAAAITGPFLQSPLTASGVPIDMENPLQTFRWPYSPFTSEFRTLHRSRNRLVGELTQTTQEMKSSNMNASLRLQELDHRLQSSRQDLSTCLDEIQFRKSQLRDMSLMAVDIVKKLSRGQQQQIQAPIPIQQHEAQQTIVHDGSARPGHEEAKKMSMTMASMISEPRPGQVGTEATDVSIARTSSTGMSHVEHAMMDVDHESSGDDQNGSTYQGSDLKGLNEGNVRSFLEKIRELEQAQRRVVA